MAAREVSLELASRPVNSSRLRPVMNRNRIAVGDRQVLRTRMGSRTDEKRPVKRDCVVARCSVPQRISPAASLKEKLHSSTSGCVCRFGEAFDKGKKLVRLSDEQSSRRQGRHRVQGRAFGGRGTNDRADREVAAEEYRGFRHDQVSFEIFAGIVRQLRKRHWYAG